MNYYNKTFKKYNHANCHNSGIIAVSMLLSLMIAILGFVYIYQTNSLVDCSYKIRENKKQLEQLAQKNQELQMKVTAMQSPARLEQETKNLGMVKVENPAYLEYDTEVAVKN